MSVIEPTIRLRQLGIALRRHREAAGLTPEEAAQLLTRSASSILRIEKGLHHTPVRDVEYFLVKYGVVDPAIHKRLYELSRHGRKKGWWQGYKDLVSPGDMDLFGIEEDSDRIDWFELILIPGLLQTEAYARAILRVGSAAGNQTQIDRLVEIRLKRQQILLRPNPPKLQVIVHEAALRQTVGAPEVMRAQLRHILKLIEAGKLVLQVLPESAGGFVGMTGAFVTLSLDEPVDLKVVAVASLVGTTYHETDAAISSYCEAFATLRRVALSEQESHATLRRLSSES